MKAVRTLHKLVIISCTAATTLVGTVGPGLGAEPPQWLASAVSTNHALRQAGVDNALQERTETIDRLVSVVESPVEFLENFTGDTKRNAAIRLLGELRAVEAVPALIGFLVGTEKHYGGDGVFPSPAREALIKIGSPSIPHLLAQLDREPLSEIDVLRRQECLRVMAAILGVRGTRLLVQHRAATLSDEVRSMMLGKALDEMPDNDRMRRAYGEWGMLERRVSKPSHDLKADIDKDADQPTVSNTAQ